MDHKSLPTTVYLLQIADMYNHVSLACCITQYSYGIFPLMYDGMTGGILMQITINEQGSVHIMKAYQTAMYNYCLYISVDIYTDPVV